MYSNVVLGINTAILESNLEDLKEARGVHQDTELTASDMEELVKVYKSVILEDHGIVFPQEPMEQLWRGRHLCNWRVFHPGSINRREKILW